VEVFHAMRAEGALDAADVLDRRTRIGLVPADRVRAAGPVEDVLAAVPRAAAA
jgi:glycerol-3-phosphate dehydrogenase